MLGSCWLNFTVLLTSPLKHYIVLTFNTVLYYSLMVCKRLCSSQRPPNLDFLCSWRLLCETGISLRRLEEGAGYALGSVAVIFNLGTLFEMALEPGRCVVVMCLSKSTRACLCCEDNTAFLSLKQILGLFY